MHRIRDGREPGRDPADDAAVYVSEHVGRLLAALDGKIPRADPQRSPLNSKEHEDSKVTLGLLLSRIPCYFDADEGAFTGQSCCLPPGNSRG